MTKTTDNDAGRAADTGSRPAAGGSAPQEGGVTAPQGSTSTRTQENADTPIVGSLGGQSGAAVSLLARVILPRPGEPLDVRKLYLEESKTNIRRAHPTTRTTLQIGAECGVSFATYFNAFPASYWRRWTTCTSVVLRAELTGAGRVDVYRTKATGARIFVDGREFASIAGQPETLEFQLGLEPFEDGGWIWFDITTESDVTLCSAGWYSDQPAPGVANVAVGIPTFNRPDDCVNALRELTSDPLVDTVIGAVIVPDQGSAKLREHPDFAVATAPLGNRLSIHDQPNLGGSGGYSRVMYEALKNTDCQQILYMDDDIRLEPDTILRVLAMSRFAKAPMLVGGQMLNLQEPSHLHIMGEMVDRSIFMWGAAPFAEYDHDFAKFPLSDDDNPRSKLLHRRIDVDFNGWWTCMIPRQVAEELGQPLPLFIKWDDAEYGLRAAEHGYPTATLPGAAIWHMAWSDKDDAIDWQAYFHLRNRLVVAAMHWDLDVTGLVRSHLKATLKHLACLEYSTVAIQNKAIDDFLAGPEHIFSILENALPDVRRMRKVYPDAVVLPSSDELPAPSQRNTEMKPPVSPLVIGYRLARGTLHQFTRADPAHHRRPQVNVPTQDARWFRLCTVDGATVTTADGRGVVYRQRDRAKMFELLWESLRRQRQLLNRFDELRRVYRAALPMLSSMEKWETVLLPHPGSSPGNGRHRA
jgi:galactofuranosylgalactofuranosylrhamnosyl-N-acetylglucosaminyl-diphospho-decaprenol beta-1,5/1,6-galactofuranosyltransferase